jgi:hypothetical protein
LKEKPKDNFKSQFERDVFNNIERNGLTAEYEPFKIPYVVSPSNYWPDVVLPNGIIIELKGYFDTRSQVKMKAVKRCNPHLDIRFVFMNSKNKMNKRSKMTYALWCDKYGFPYADGMIPIAWWKERKKK